MTAVSIPLIRRLCIRENAPGGVAESKCAEVTVFASALPIVSRSSYPRDFFARFDVLHRVSSRNIRVLTDTRGCRCEGRIYYHVLRYKLSYAALRDKTCQREITQGESAIKEPRIAGRKRERAHLFHLPSVRMSVSHLCGNECEPDLRAR